MIQEVIYTVHASPTIELDGPYNSCFFMIGFGPITDVGWIKIY